MLFKSLIQPAEMDMFFWETKSLLNATENDRI